MPTNRKLRSALLGKLGVTPQALSQRVKRKRQQLTMSTEDATYVIAHEEGVPIHKYLRADEVDRVRHLQTQLRSSGVAASRVNGVRRPTSASGPREIRFPQEFRLTNPLLAPAKLAEAVEMARIFPLLYVLENSMRELIDRVMTAAYGPNWWDTELTTGKLKTAHQTATTRRRDEHAWHQRRGSRPIDYVDIADLEAIILGKQSLFFPAIIQDREWFIQFMKELRPSRNVVCHMNPLDRHNVDDVKVKVRKWENLVNRALSTILGAIPAPSVSRVSRK